MTNFIPRAHSRRAWPSGRPSFWSSARADRTDGAIAYDGEWGAHIHSGHKAFGGRADSVNTLVGEADAFDFFAGITSRKAAC